MDASDIKTARDRNSPGTETGYKLGIKEMDTLPAMPQAIKTKGVFPIMELPAELRLKIYPHLLISDEVITVNSLMESDVSIPAKVSPRPSVAILSTCRRINEEGSPILYGQNGFIIYLTMDPGPSFSLTNSFILKSLRWSSISYLTSLTFISNSSPLPGFDGSLSGTARSRPAFHCTGAAIIDRFKPNDFRYSPNGPDEYMALSVSNWISTQVMRIMLTAFQQELEAMMRPSDMYAMGATYDGENRSADGNEE